MNISLESVYFGFLGNLVEFSNHVQPIKRGRGRPPGPSKRSGPVNIGFKDMQSAKKRKTRRKTFETPKLVGAKDREKEILVIDCRVMREIKVWRKDMELAMRNPR